MTFINNLNISLLKDIGSIADQLTSEGLSLPSWTINTILIVVLLSIIITAFKIIHGAVYSIKNYLQSKMHDENDKKFIKLKNNFVENLVYRIDRLNKDDNWSELFYTNLDAEIEVDSSIDVDINALDSLMIWAKSFYYLIFKLIGFSSTSKIKKNLVKAIFKSSSHAFLVLGDPGSGKTISLRHLFFEKARICLRSGNRNAEIPIYLNLKHLDIDPEQISPSEIRKWIIKWLIKGQDRTINEFVAKHFDELIKLGGFFYIYDSFDEIPSVLDAHEEDDVIEKYAKALDDFIHSNPCRGLVSSRPYRSPSTFVGQRMTILQLSNSRIKEAINKYLLEENAKIADLIWNQLELREDLLFLARYPFYLALIVEYSKHDEKLPEKQYDLFEHFVINRANLDKSRLEHFGLKPSDLLNDASMLAFALFNKASSLEATSDEIFNILHNYDPMGLNHIKIDWTKEKIISLIEALCYSKLGRKSHDQAFSFVHRRFHEYFCARYISQYPDRAPISKISEDDRWREVLVLLCEVLGRERLDDIFNYVRKNLALKTNQEDNFKTGEIVRFIKDGFRSRIADVPDDIRLQCTQYVVQQFNSKNLLEIKRATELISLVDDKSIYHLLESILKSDSSWLRETALRSCNILGFIPNSLKLAVRKHLYSKYLDLQLLKEFNSYKIIFSSSFKLHDLSYYYNTLIFFSIFQILLFLIFIGFYYIYNIYSLAILAAGISFIFIMDASDFNILGRTRFFWVRLYLGIFIGYISILFLNKIVKFLGNTMNAYMPSELGTSYIINYLTLVFVLNICIYPLVNNYLRYILIQLAHPIFLITKSFKIIKIVLSIKYANYFKQFIYYVYDRTIGNPRPFLEGLLFIIIFYSVLGIYLYMSIKSFEIISKYNYSIFKFYSSEGLLIFVLVLLSIAANIFIVGRIVLFFGNKILYRLTLVVDDQVRITRLLLIQQKRPSTATEAILFMNELKSDIGRKQYLQSLRKWLPTGDNPQLFIDQTIKYKNKEIIDELYKIAEQWDDYLRKSHLK